MTRYSYWTSVGMLATWIMLSATGAESTPPASPPVAAAGSRAAGPDFSHTHYAATQLKPSLYLLSSGDNAPNTLAFIGAEGVFLVDTTYGQLAQTWTEALHSAIGKRPVRFAALTHWHPDHTGELAQLSAEGASVIANSNASLRMSRDAFNPLLHLRSAGWPESRLPGITYSSGELVYRFGGDVIHLYHPQAAHTDGDSVVFFERANVIHMGDIYFAQRYPFVDLDSGGSVNGVIAAVDVALGLGNSQTVIVPGHGPVGSKSDLKAYRDALAQMQSQVRTLMLQGRTSEEITALHPAALDLPVWKPWGVVSADRFVALIYNDLRYHSDPAAGDSTP